MEVSNMILGFVKLILKEWINLFIIQMLYDKDTITQQMDGSKYIGVLCYLDNSINWQILIFGIQVALYHFPEDLQQC